MELPDKEPGQHLNFGCGALLGFCVGLLSALGSGWGLAATLLTAAGTAVGIGVLTAIFGDRVLAWVLAWFD